jgi:AraC family transcriptional regulator
MIRTGVVDKVTERDFSLPLRGDVSQRDLLLGTAAVFVATAANMNLTPTNASRAAFSQTQIQTQSQAHRGKLANLPLASFMSVTIGYFSANGGPDANGLDAWLGRVLRLLEMAIDDQEPGGHGPRYSLAEAAKLLREQIGVRPEGGCTDGRGHLQTWQARKVRDYIEIHIAEPLRVADLCVLIERSEAYFSRAFKRTFGESPHAFLVRRRLQLAKQYMLETDAPLTDIALRCGFSDQAHFCKHFRQISGATPASWRRIHRASGAFSLPKPDPCQKLSEGTRGYSVR